ncbi:hypothetical protein M413DRAFT_439597, partial [Hebeloma cylindrosporum]
MLKHISTLSLLESVVPSLVCRARAFSKPAFASQRKIQDEPLLHAKIRDQIMAQNHKRRIVPDALKEKRNTTLVRIKRAIENRDIVAAITHWASLRALEQELPDEEMYRVPDTTTKALHNLLHSVLNSRTPAAWSDTLKMNVQNFAVLAATHGFTGALETLMDHLIRQGEPQVILDLYRSYTQILPKNITSSSEPINNDDELGLLDGEEFQSVHPGRESILLAVITAYAMNDCFQAALDLYISANVRISRHRRQRLLRKLSNDIELHQKVQTYLERLNIAYLVAKPSALSRHIMNLAYPRSARSLEKLYHDILDGISGPEPYLVADKAATSSATTLAMSEIGWTSFQTGFIRSERMDLAVKMWDDLAKCGVIPGVTMWTALLDTYAGLRDSNKAMITWNNMLRKGIRPDTLSYRAMIAVLFDDNKPEEALKRFKEYQLTCRDDQARAMNVYNTVLKGLLRIKRIDEAKLLMNSLQDKGLHPDIVSFNTLLAYYCRQNDFKALSGVVADMSAASIPGDVVTFSTILSALLRIGKKDAPVTILNLMRKQGIQPNVATYSAIIDHQMREQSEDNLKAVISLLDKMEQDESTRPNEVTYTSILSGLYRGVWVPREKADLVRKDLVARMRRFQIAFRLPTYHILIRAALESPDPKGYLDALSLVREMEEQGIPMTTSTWYILFAGLMHRELWDVAKEMVAKMDQSGHEPTPRLDKLVQDIIRH